MQNIWIWLVFSVLLVVGVFIWWQRSTDRFLPVVQMNEAEMGVVGQPLAMPTSTVATSSSDN